MTAPELLLRVFLMSKNYWISKVKEVYGSQSKTCIRLSS